MCTKCAWYVCPYGPKQAQMVRSQEVLQCHITLSQTAVIAPVAPKNLKVTDKAGSASHLATRTSCVTLSQRHRHQAVFFFPFFDG